MDQSRTTESVFHKTFYEFYPTKDIIKGFPNLLHCYLPNGEGNIIDIGCGQSEFILSMVDENFNFWAVDKNPFALQYLNQRITDIDKSLLSKVTFMANTVEDISFGDIKFDGIILSNVLHFYKEKDSAAFVSGIRKISKPGSIWYIKVHSTKHPLAAKGCDYFKDFYDIAKIESLFPKKSFQWLHCAEIQHLSPPKELDFKKAYAKAWYGTHSEVQDYVDRHVEENNIHASIELVVRERQVFNCPR